MNNLLNQIEESEHNNPLLTAALQEIERLNKLIHEAKHILNTSRHEVTFQEDNEPPYTPTFSQLNSSKVELLCNLLD